jgi:hypothetical protein
MSSFSRKKVYGDESLMLPARYCLGTHLQLVTIASFTYTDGNMTGTVRGKEKA